MTTKIGTHCVHIAIYKWKQNAPIDEIEAAIDNLQEIANDVPGIRLITWGRNASEYARGFSHAILIVSNTSEDIQSYRNHTLHQHVANLLERWERVGVGIDFDKHTSDCRK